MLDTIRRDTLQSLRCTKLPPILWRVQHADSQASFDALCNLTARLSDSVPSSLYELRASLTRHLKWGYSRAESYFISTFDSYDLALQWARERHEGEGATIYKIRTLHISAKVLIYNVEKTFQKLKIEPPGRNAPHEYVVLNMIPARAISLFEVLGGRVEEERERERSARETPWERTLSRSSRHLSMMSTGSDTLLCEEYLRTLEMVQRRKSVFERVCEWGPEEEEEESRQERDVSPVGSERDDEEEEVEEQEGNEEVKREIEERSPEDEVPGDVDTERVDSMLAQTFEISFGVIDTGKRWYAEDGSVTPLRRQ